jgi:hypothetical protein
MLLFMDGFDHYTTLANKWPTASGYIISSAAGRNGTSGLRRNGGNAIIRVPLSPTPTIIVGFTFLYTDAGPLVPLGNIDESGIGHLRIDLATGGFIRVIRNATGTALGTSTGALLPGVRYFVEIKATIHDTAGSVEVRVDGATWLQLTNVDTRNGGTGVVDTFGFGAAQGGAIQTDYDDLYICDNSGASNNDFLGDVKVETLRPTGSGAHTDFTPSAGSNWQNVDDAAPNDDTDYNSSAVAGARDSFAMSDLATSQGSVKAVQQMTRLRKDDAGTRTARASLRVGATDYDGAGQSVQDTYVSRLRVVEQNPATSAPWTISDVNALEAGYELVS